MIKTEWRTQNAPAFGFDSLYYLVGRSGAREPAAWSAACGANPPLLVWKNRPNIVAGHSGYPSSSTLVKQVRELGLENSSDQDIWEFARTHGFSIVTFDADFMI